MKKYFAFVVFFGLLSLAPASADTLNVVSSAVKSGSLYNYTETFSISGTTLTLDNLFLGSDDLSPLNVAFTFDNAATANWSWFSDNNPRNYIDFYNTAGGVLGPADTLKVTFTSFLGPSASHFAVGENSITNATSNMLNSVVAPTAAPEPGSALMLLCGIGALGLWVIRKRTARA